MRRLPAFLVVVAAIQASARPVLQRRDATDYDIILSTTADISSVLSSIDMSTDGEYIANTYENTQFKGFSGSFTAEEIETLSNIAEVSVVDTTTNTTSDTAAVSSPAYTYTYADNKLGAGVDIYIVDTGIRTTHKEFGGRATMGYTYYSDSDTDDYGHGTHVSGTSAGSTVGVASNASLIGVKVLTYEGEGTSSGLIAGIDYVVSAHTNRSTDADFIASVASFSLSFSGRTTAVETALLALSSAGIHAAVAAGNDATNACLYTPSSLGGTNSSILAVGASTIADAIATDSNTGPCVDVFAPGDTVYSAYYKADDTYIVASGTSMATPHVSGLMAYLLAEGGAVEVGVLKGMVVAEAVELGVGVVGSGDIVVKNGEMGNGTVS